MPGKMTGFYELFSRGMVGKYFRTLKKNCQPQYPSQKKSDTPSTTPKPPASRNTPQQITQKNSREQPGDLIVNDNNQETQKNFIIPMSSPRIHGITPGRAP